MHQLIAEHPDLATIRVLIQSVQGAVCRYQAQVISQRVNEIIAEAQRDTSPGLRMTTAAQRVVEDRIRANLERVAHWYDRDQIRAA